MLRSAWSNGLVNLSGNPHGGLAPRVVDDFGDADDDEPGTGHAPPKVRARGSVRTVADTDPGVGVTRVGRVRS